MWKILSFSRKLCKSDNFLNLFFRETKKENNLYSKLLTLNFYSDLIRQSFEGNRCESDIAILRVTKDYAYNLFKLKLIEKMSNST